MEPQFNEPLCNKVLGIANDTCSFQPSNSVMYGKEPRYYKPISPVPWHFVKSRFHCTSGSLNMTRNHLSSKLKIDKQNTPCKAITNSEISNQVA